MRHLRSLLIRYWQAALAGALFCLVAWSVAPFVVNHISTAAVINAPLHAVLSPLNGVIEAPSRAAGVPPGTALVSVRRSIADDRALRALAHRADGAATAIAALDTRIAELDLIAADLARRLQHFQAAALARLDAERAELAAERTAAEAALDQAGARLARARALGGHVSQTVLEDAATAVRTGEAEVVRIRARIAGIEAERTAMEGGAQLRDGYNDVPYSRQRLDQLRIDRIALQADRARLVAERAELESQIGAERALMTAESRFAAAAPPGAVIWKASGEAGSSVVVGDELVQYVECDQRFLEVALSERLFGTVRPGHPVSVRLRGDGSRFGGEVVSLLGPGAKFSDPRLAADVPEIDRHQFRAIVALEQDAARVLPQEYCGIGRTAEVRFGRQGFQLGRALDRLRDGVQRLLAGVGDAGRDLAFAGLAGIGSLRLAGQGDASRGDGTAPAPMP